MASLRDPNLVRVVGLCSQDEPLCVLQEHCEFGDLPSFLQLQAGNPVQHDNPAIRSANLNSKQYQRFSQERNELFYTETKIVTMSSKIQQ